jgi:SAM-dependent methyltransferase/uncharacterized protein YbaR (Trm112 family)
MKKTELYQQWLQQQTHWDDEEYLGAISKLQRLRYRRLNERVAAFLNQVATAQKWLRPLLVDMGCGHGDFMESLESSWRYLGMDPSPEQLAYRDGVAKPFGFVQGAAECPPLRSGCAQAVLLKEVLDHGWDPARIFSEARKVLMPGGFLVVTVTNDRSWFKRLLPRVNQALKEKQTDHFHFFGPGDLGQLAREARFDSIRVDTYNHLKLPGVFEKTMGRFGEGFQRFLLGSTDRIGGWFLPRMGGGMMLTAQKPLEGGNPATTPLENFLSQPSPVSPELLEVLVCPSCGSAIRPKGDDLECAACHRIFPVKEGIPSLMPELSKGS